MLMDLCMEKKTMKDLTLSLSILRRRKRKKTNGAKLTVCGNSVESKYIDKISFI